MHLNTILSASSPKSTQPRYYVQLGAYKNPDYAKKVLLSTEFPVQIVHENTFYSVLSGPFKTKEEAKNALYKLRQKFDEAYIVQRAVTPKNSIKTAYVNRQSPLFRQALYHYQHKSYEEALALFDRILIETPNNIQAKRYYAKTLLKLQMPNEAKKEFLALKKMDLTQQDREEVDHYLQHLNRLSQKNFIRSTLMFGVGYDDNINLATQREYTQYGPYLLKNDTNKTNSSYAIASLAINHTYKAEHFSIQSLLYNYNEILHSADGNDLNFIDLSSGIYKQLSAFNLSIRVGANTTYLDGKHISYDLYTNPVLTYMPSKYLQLKFATTYTDNHTQFEAYRDYRRYDTSAQLMYVKNRTTLLGSIQAMYYRAKEDKRYDVSKDLYIYTLYAKYKLDKTLHLASKLSYEAHRFTKTDPLLGYKREDDKKRLKLTAGKSLSQKATLFLNYEYTDSDSNVNVYAYSKNLYTVLFQYRF